MPGRKGGRAAACGRARSPGLNAGYRLESGAGRFDFGGTVAKRVVIIEDNLVFRQMLASALGRVRGLVVGASFEKGKEGLAYCLRTKPDLLAVDLFLPDLHGLEIVREVRAQLPATRILVLTGHPDSDLPARLVAQGVHGYVDKAAPLSYVLQAVESLMDGGMFFATHIPPKGATGAEQAALPKVEAGAKTEVGGVSVDAVKILSAREIEVARLVAEGFSSKEVASRLDLSVRTVEKHRANIMDKIGVREVASLVRWCVQTGLVKM
jgi:DNA-binding NarL/FixJ family response regulator